MRFYDPATLERVDAGERYPGAGAWEAARLCLADGLVPSVTTLLDVIHEPTSPDGRCARRPAW